MTVKIITGDCRDVLRGMPAESVHTVVTSPPYFGLRDYKIPPSIWGGDPACVHEWGDVQLVSSGTGLQGSSSQRVGRSNVLDQEAHKERGNFCQLCGAWLGTLGLEPDYRLYLVHMVEVFREVRRVMRPDATLWLNMGDSYASGVGMHRGTHTVDNSGWRHLPFIESNGGPAVQPNRTPQVGLKPKDRMMMPARVAIALCDDGWYLRDEIVWEKPNPMPESVTDRTTKAHEMLYLLSKNERYYFDQEAILEDASANTHARLPGNGYKTPDGWDTSKGNGGHGSFHKEGREAGQTGYQHKACKRMGGGNKSHKGVTEYENSSSEEHRTKAGLVEYSRKMAAKAAATPRKMAEPGSGVKNNASMDAALAIMPLKRNKRSVWTIATQPFAEAHFATFPPALIEPCILAGCPRGGMVLDPFGGSGTTGLVADRLKRNAILIELNPDYAAMAKRRIKGDAPLFADVL